MALVEFIKLCLVFEKRLKALHFVEFSSHKVLQTVAELRDCRKVNRLRIRTAAFYHTLRRIRGTCCHEELRVVRNHRLFRRKLQRLHEAVAQHVEEVERSAQESDVSANWLSACKAAECLAHHRLENGSGNIFTAGTLVDERLHVRLGKYTAARGYWVNGRCPAGEFVQAGGIRFKERRHLVNERARTAGTRTVHALLYTAGEVGDFCILSTKLYDNISLRNQLPYGSSCGHHFLNERNGKPL